MKIDVPGSSSQQQGDGKSKSSVRVLAAVACCALCLFHLLSFAAVTADGIVRLVIGVAFFLLILFRRESILVAREPGSTDILVMGISGAFLFLLGTVFGVNQFTWLGLMLLLYACLRWASPAGRSVNVAAAVFLFYWVHPLPGQVFGPFRLLMQRMSVAGAEWLSHCLNMRVWADGLFLRTATRMFEVPEACSGMRTVTTVLLCCLGCGIVFRFRWYGIVVFLLSGALQVLALNVIRITTMVGVAANKPPEWSVSFLHDSAGAFLLAAIVLVQFEALLWRRRSNRGMPGEPTDWRAWFSLWRFVQRHQHRRRVEAAPISVLFLALALVVLVPLTIYKSRASHRAAMVGDVMEALKETDIAAAERAWVAVDGFLRDKPRSHLLNHVRLLLLQRKYDAALQEIDSMGAREQGPDIAVARTWALIGIGSTNEVAALLRNMPAAYKEYPGVAVVAAEFSVSQDEVEDVEYYAVRAARAPLLINRVRNLFPYLASRGKWRTIRELDSPAPFVNEISFLMALTVALAEKDSVQAEKLLRNNRRLWSGKALFFDHLLHLALQKSESVWRDEYISSFAKALESLSEDQLCNSSQSLLALRRPDMAWVAYNRLKALDPGHPGLFGIPAKFARQWFLFRKRDLGLAAGDPLETVDVRFAADLPDDWLSKLSPSLRSIPLSEEFGGKDWRNVRAAMIDTCLGRLEERAAAGELSYAMKLLYADMLEAKGRTGDALSLLDRMVKSDQARKQGLLLRRARLHALEKDWQSAYESLRELDLRSSVPALAADQTMIVPAG